MLRELCQLLESNWKPGTCICVPASAKSAQSYQHVSSIAVVVLSQQLTQGNPVGACQLGQRRRLAFCNAL